MSIFHDTVALSLWRPNRLRGDRVGDSLQQEFYYDGKIITVYDLTTKYYATWPHRRPLSR
jgi:hypothetical protein